MKDLTFLHPWFFLLLALLPLIGYFHYRKNYSHKATLKMSSVDGLKGIRSWASKLKPHLILVRLLALAFLITALARPRTVNISNDTKSTKGIDIVMAVDVSGSMLSRDLQPNRLEALKVVAAEFVKNRPNDRIGIVVYTSEAYTKTPVTSDKAVVLNAVNEIRFDPILTDGTGIGMGLATAVNRLKESKAKSKVVILLTDGVNNAGFVEPETASKIAAEYGIKVYTIALGTKGEALSPYAVDVFGKIQFKKMPVEVDEVLMKKIAKNTGGKYFRATDNSKLEQIYKSIDKLEKTEIKELKFYDYDEWFRPFVLICFGLLVLEFLLKNTIFKSFI